MRVCLQCGRVFSNLLMRRAHQTKDNHRHAIPGPAVPRALSSSPLAATTRTATTSATTTAATMTATDRKWVGVDGRTADTAAKLRVVTYNILGDGKKLSLSEKHAYCPLELREWEGRWARLLEEVDHYGADVYCIQESLLKHWSSHLQPAMEKRGFHAVHVLTSLASDDEGNKREEASMGVAMFVRSSVFQVEVVEGHLYRLLLALHGQQFTAKNRKRLKTLQDGLLLTKLRHKLSGAEVIVATTHLYWDPNWPQTKASQAAMACAALAAFKTRHAADAPVVLCGDFNSVPAFNPLFLPAAARKSVDSIAAPPTSFQGSGVYTLLHAGFLPPYHPEHPATFGKAIDVPASLFGATIDQERAHVSNQEPSHTKKSAKTKYKTTNVGAEALRSPLRLHSAYEVDTGGTPLPLTTKCDDFNGTLDYILSELPPTALLQTLEMPYDQSQVDCFSSIPNAAFPSDHLALGATYKLV